MIGTTHQSPKGLQKIPEIALEQWRDDPLEVNLSRHIPVGARHWALGDPAALDALAPSVPFSWVLRLGLIYSTSSLGDHIIDGESVDCPDYQTD